MGWFHLVYQVTSSRVDFNNRGDQGLEEPVMNSAVWLLGFKVGFGDPPNAWWWLGEVCQKKEQTLPFVWPSCGCSVVQAPLNRRLLTETQWESAAPGTRLHKTARRGRETLRWGGETAGGGSGVGGHNDKP